MNVLWIVPGYPWPECQVPFIFHRLQAQALAAQGVQVTVVAPTPWVPGVLRGNQRWKKYANAPRCQHDGEVTVFRPRYLTTPRENVLGISHYFQPLAIRAADIPRPDIVHGHFAYPCGATALAVGRRLKCPVVVTLHGDDVTVYPHYNHRMRRLFQDVMRGCDRVLAVSSALGALTQDLSGVTPEVLSTGIDLDHFRPFMSKREARQRLGLPTEGYIVLYVGALIAEKGVLDLAAAMRSLAWSDAVTVFVGDGPSKPEGQGVRLAGPQANEDIPLFLAAADLFVLPSWHEGLGQAAVEAGAANLPVVGAETGGLAGLLANDRGFTFPPGDVRALAQTIRHAREVPDEAHRRAARLRAHVELDHNLHGNAARLAVLYRSLKPAESEPCVA